MSFMHIFGIFSRILPESLRMRLLLGKSRFPHRVPSASTFSSIPSFNLIGGSCKGNPDPRRVFIMKLVPLKRMQHHRGLTLIFEINKAKKEFPSFPSLLGNEPGIDKSWERPENMTDFPLSGVIWNS